LGAVQIPELYCPFPPAISPHAEAVQQLINRWMQEQHYLRTEAALRRFKAAKFAWLTGRVHPEASFESIFLVASYMSWLFMLDDLCDEAALGRDPERLRIQLFELVERMKHPRPLRGDESPVVVGLAELWELMLLRAAPGWAERFIQTFEGYALACLWEARNRAHNRVPPLAEYIAYRRHTSAVYAFFALIELAEGVTLPAEVREHLRALEVRANDGVCWINDISSLDKERDAGDVHNLVIVLQHEQALSSQGAIDQAASLFNSRMREYVELEQRLPSLGAAIDVPLQRYLRGLQCWVRGNLDWSFESGRYGAVRPLPPLARIAS
jgi:Terpene synthase family 2, C-terminal metal binding